MRRPARRATDGLPCGAWGRLRLWGVPALLLCTAAAWAQSPSPGGAAAGGVARSLSAASARVLPASVAALGEELLGRVGALVARQPAGWDDGEATAAFRTQIAAAVDSHPDSKASQAQAEAGTLSVGEARAALFPQVSGVSSGGYRRIDRDTVLGTPAREQPWLTLGVSVSQLLHDFGATAALVSGSVARERAAALRLASTRADLAYRAIAVSVELARAQEHLNLARENVSARASILKLVRERFETGGGSQADVIRAEARWLDAGATLTSVEMALQAAQSAWTEVFGREAETLDWPPELPLAELAEPLARVAQRFGSVQELSAQAEAARADARAAASRLWPSLSLELTGSRRDLVGSGSPGTDASAQFVVRYNFFTGGAEVARRDRAQAQARQVDAQREALLRQIERALAQALSAAGRSDPLVQARRDAARRSMDSLRVVREQFAFNRGSLLDLLRVQEELHTAARDLVDAAADRELARLRLLHLGDALGPLFAPREAPRPAGVTK
jgi:adhesin transport system outer membrane protein